MEKNAKYFFTDLGIPDQPLAVKTLSRRSARFHFQGSITLCNVSLSIIVKTQIKHVIETGFDTHKKERANAERRIEYQDS